MKCIDFQSPDITSEEYHCRPELSHSGVKVFNKKGPLVFQWEVLLGNGTTKESPCLNLGSAFHFANEHPEGWRAKYVEEPIRIDGEPVNRRLKKHKEALAEFRTQAALNGQIVLEPGDTTNIPAMLESMQENPAAAQYLEVPGGHEVVGIAKEESTGLGVRALADLWIPEWHEGNTIVDFKTTACCTPEEWVRMAFERWSYNFQAAWYSDVFSAQRFVFIVVRNEPPWECWVRVVNPSVIRHARQANMTALKEIKSRMDRDDWHVSTWGAEYTLVDEEKRG